MTDRISNRARSLHESDIRRMTTECLRRGGINLGQGLCRLPAPDFVRQAAAEAIQSGENYYSAARGRSELLTWIARKLEAFNGISADPETEIVVTAGATGGFTCAVNALLEPGDGILLLEPFYPYHRNASLLAGLEVQYVRLQQPGYRIEKEALEEALRRNTRALVLCTPSNPSGRVFTEEELRAVAHVAERHDLLVITDEVYEHITFGAHRHRSPASLPELRPRTVTISGFSKTFSVTGWRIGYAVAQPGLAEAVRRVHDAYYVCSATPLQLGVSSGYRADSGFFNALRRAYEERKDRLSSALRAAGLRPSSPEGAYYLLADTGGWGLGSAREAATHLLEQAGIAAVPGSAFHNDGGGEQQLRFCFAQPDEVLDEACRRLGVFAERARRAS